MTLFVNLIELISLLGIGLMAGASLYISWMEVPARQDLAALDKFGDLTKHFSKGDGCAQDIGNGHFAFALLMALGPFTAKKLRRQMKYCSASHRRQTLARSNAKFPIGDVCIIGAHG